MKNLKLIILTTILTITLTLLPSISTASNHERGYKRGKIIQKHLSRSQSNKRSRLHNNQGYYDRGHNEHNEHNDHDRHDHHYDHYDHHDHYSHDRHHHGHWDRFGHWFSSINHNSRHGFGFQFGFRK